MRNKFGARKKVCRHGHKHDSEGEAHRCDELHLLLGGKRITALEVQPEIEVATGFLLRDRRYKPTFYRPDFSYVESESGKTIYEDFKGHQPRLYQLKRKLFLFTMSRRMPDADWEFREVTKNGVKVF